MLTKKVAQPRLRIDELKAQWVSGWRSLYVVVRQLLTRQKSRVHVVYERLLNTGPLGRRYQAMTQRWCCEVMPETGWLGACGLGEVKAQGGQVAHDCSFLALFFGTCSAVCASSRLR